MDAIIFAAGRGERLRPLTDTVPKPLVPVAGMGTLPRLLHELPAEISRVIIVVGYLADVIRAEIGLEFSGKTIEYVEQAELNGTGGALTLVRDVIRGERFLVCMGDDVYVRKDLKHMLAHDRSLLVRHVQAPKAMDAWRVHNGRVEVLRTCEVGEDVWLNCGAYVLGHEWFAADMQKTPGKEHEYSLPHTLATLPGLSRYETVEASFWQMCGTLQEIELAERSLQMRNAQR